VLVWGNAPLPWWRRIISGPPPWLYGQERAQILDEHHPKCWLGTAAPVC
jgi:hypothetical protein